MYSRNGVNITSTPVEHYTTAGPVAYRLDWDGLSVTYSGVHANAIVPLPMLSVPQCSQIYPVAFQGKTLFSLLAHVWLPDVLTFAL